MRPNRRGRDSQEDQNLQSRIQLKNKLNFVSDSFSISRLTQSAGDNHKMINMFPHINEPTIEFKETEQSNNLKLEGDDSLEHYQSQGLTARLSYQQPSANQLFVLEQRIESLMKEVEHKEMELRGARKKNELLQREIERGKKELLKKDETIELQMKEIASLREKQAGYHQSRTHSSSSKSVMEQSLSNFCPELLSPEETVQLLRQLLKKVSKSSKMVSSLASEAGTKQILSKMNKN